METNNSQEYTLDFLGNEVRKGDLIYAIIHIRPDNLIKRKFVHAIIEDIRCGDVFSNIDGIERRFNAGSFGWFKASEISKLHPKCMTCKHLGRNTPFNIYEGCNKREAQNGGRLKGLRLLDPNKDYCSNHETNKD